MIGILCLLMPPLLMVIIRKNRNKNRKLNTSVLLQWCASVIGLNMVMVLILNIFFHNSGCLFYRLNTYLNFAGKYFALSTVISVFVALTEPYFEVHLRKALKWLNALAIKRMRNTILLYTITFFLLILIGYLPLWKNGISIIWNVDGIGQYYPAFLYIGQYLRNFFSGVIRGEIILPVWDLSIGLGEDIVGVLNYYGFGDPINLLSVFATNNNGAYIFTICFILRLWLAGYTFQLYCQEININRVAAMISSLCYVFSGFAVYGGGRYIEWLSVLIYFPLLLLGAEKIIKGKKTAWTLILATAYGALCGFYFLYMSCLCLSVYCFVRLISRYGLNSVKKFLQKCFVLIWNFLLGLFLAAPIFLSAVSAYFNSERRTQGNTTQ